MPNVAESALEAAGIGAWEFDVASRRLTWTATAFRIHDLEPAESPPPEGVFEFYPPEDRAVAEAAAQAALEHGTPWDLELKLTTALGRHIWVRARGGAVQEHGRTVKLFGAVEDITARHELAAREARFSLVARQINNVVMTMDRDGRLEWVNDAFTRVTGYTLEDVRGRIPGEVLNGPETDPETVAHIADCVRAGLGFEVEVLDYAKDGRTLWMAVVCSPMRDATGALTGFISVETDVTARREAERLAGHEAAERERAEALLRDILDTLPSAITAYDSDERFVLANRAYTEMFPISAGLTVPGRRHEEIVRQALDSGQYADAPTTPVEREAWVTDQLELFRAGAARILHLGDGRVMQVREGKSRSGTLVTVRTDTTDLHVAQENARREAAERERAEVLLREVLDTLPNAVTAYDADERFIMANRAYADMVPIAAGFAVPGRRLEDVLRLATAHGQYADAPEEPAAREAFIAEHLHYFRTASPRTLRLSDGRYIEVRERRSATGTLVSVRTDTTDVHVAEAKARTEVAERERAEALLRDVLDTLPNGVIAHDKDERLILANRSYLEMFPVSARFAAPGSRLEDMIRGAALHGQYADVPESEAEFEPWFAAVMQNQRSGAEHKIRLPDGRVIELKARRSESGTLVSVRTDITDLTRAEALLRDVLDAIPNAVTAYDAEERFILCNRAYIEMFPVSAQIAAPGRRYEEVVRYAVSHRQYPQAGTTPQEQEAWIATQVAHHRNPVGERKLRMADGRFVLARECRSNSGNLVSVRTDTTELVRAEGLMRDILESLPSAVMAYDHEERLLLWNQEAVRMLPVVAPFASPGLTLTQMLRLSAQHGQYFDVGDSPEAREKWVAQQLVAYRAGDVRTLHLPDGRIVQAREKRSDNGNLVCVRTDMTELVRAQALLRDVLDALPSAVNAYDAEGRLILTNRVYGELFPIAARFSVLGADRRDILRQAAEHGQFPQAGSRPEEHAAWLAEWLAADRPPGSPRTMSLPHGRYVQAQESRSETGVTVCVHTDTTDLKRAEDDLRFQAERDPLTLLANRSAFLAALGRALADVAGTEGGGALLLLDVDYFKQINDTLGHDQGDALLVEIAARLREILRTGDVAARLGGDEFGVVIPGLTDAASAAPRITAVHAALSAPVELAGRRTPIGISLGVTLFPLDGTDAAKLLKNADLALYEAKRTGRGRWASFRAEQAVALERHVHMADAVRRALAQNQFTVALQPKRLLRGGGHAGFEALARWHDGDRWVPPTEFIPVAEDTGLIGALGRVVMAAALERMRDIRDAGLDPGRVAVNVTGPQLLDSHFKTETLDMLRRHGLRPADLELELTETILLGRAAERIDAVLRDFSRLGVTLALDDFGTGYASLAHLSRLPIDRLKIDRSFVEGIGSGGPGGVIARTIVSLAHSLDMEAIAEGVETPEQVAFLEAAGCDVAQGFLFSRPLLSTGEAIAYLRAMNGPPAPPRRLIARIAHG